jgi:tRNA(fMet)-specific endonuclease VapC
MFLLDTNIATALIKGGVPAVDRAVGAVPMEQLAISAVTEGELIYGLERKPQAARLRVLVEDFLRHVTVLAWDSAAARLYGAVRATLEKSGQPMGSLDMMIGAHALSDGAVLVTHDRAFKRIRGLKIEDWTV